MVIFIKILIESEDSQVVKPESIMML